MGSGEQQRQEMKKALKSMNERKIRDYATKYGEDLSHATLIAAVSDVADALRESQAREEKLREALKDISIEGHHARSGGTAYRMALIARAALREDNDDA